MEKKESKEKSVIDYRPEFTKIVVVLWVIAALLFVMGIIMIVQGSNGSSSTKTTDTETTEENSADYDVSMFDAIDQSGFMTAVKAKDLSIIYLGRSTCGYCVQFLPNMQKAQENYDFTMKYVDVTAVDENSDDYTKMVDLINGMTDTYNKEYSQEYESLYGYTPTVVAVKNGKIEKIWIGYSEYEDFASWLEKAGVEKK